MKKRFDFGKIDYYGRGSRRNAVTVDMEYTEKDGVTFIKLLKEIGYTKQENATASFEMRPYENMGAMQTLEKFVSVWQSAQ